MKTPVKVCLFYALCACAQPTVGAESQERGLLTPDPGLAIWTLLTFLVMLGLLAKFALKPIAAALDRRNEAIRASLAEADKARAEMRAMSDEAKKALDAAKLEGSKILDETRSVAESMRKEILQKAEAEASEMIRQAQEEIERRKQKAITEMRQILADLSIQITEQVIKQRLDEQMHRQLADDFIANIAQQGK